MVWLGILGGAERDADQAVVRARASAHALAGALGAGHVVFICADDELIHAAQSLGLSVDNPERHP